MMDSLTFHSASQSSARERLCLTTLYAATGFTIGSINGAVAVKPVCPRFGKLASSNDPAAIELKSLRNQSNSERHDDSGDTATCGCTSCAVPLTEVINQSGLALKRGE